MPSIRDAGPVLEGWFWQALLDEPPHVAWIGHVEVLALQNKKKTAFRFGKQGSCF